MLIVDLFISDLFHEKVTGIFGKQFHILLNACDAKNADIGFRDPVEGHELYIFRDPLSHFLKSHVSAYRPAVRNGEHAVKFSSFGNQVLDNILAFRDMGAHFRKRYDLILGEGVAAIAVDCFKSIDPPQVSVGGMAAAEDDRPAAAVADKFVGSQLSGYILIALDSTDVLCLVSGVIAVDPYMRKSLGQKVLDGEVVAADQYNA